MTYSFSPLSKEIIELSGKKTIELGDFVTWRNGQKKGMVRALIPSGVKPSECYPWLSEIDEADMNFVLECDYIQSADRALVQRPDGWLAVFISKLEVKDYLSGNETKEMEAEKTT